MINQQMRIKIDIEQTDVFPAVIDYDFVNDRPRGGSCRIDFFSYGKLSSMLEGVTTKPYVFVKKQNTFFEKGMILADFSLIDKDIDAFASMIEKLGVNTLYLEESELFPLDKVLSKIKNLEIIMMSFIND